MRTPALRPVLPEQPGDTQPVSLADVAADVDSTDWRRKVLSLAAAPDGTDLGWMAPDGPPKAGILRGAVLLERHRVAPNTRTMTGSISYQEPSTPRGKPTTEQGALLKVAYVFATSGHTVDYKLGQMILPQLEEGRHGADVVGMFFFDDNNYVLRAGDPIGERLAKVAAERGTLLMMCDRCALSRGLAEGQPGDCKPVGTVTGVTVGCFPDLYAALATNPPDQVISL